MREGYFDYYGEIGCCLTCSDQEVNEINEFGDCLCYDCKCRQCFWYQSDTLEWECGVGKGHCEYPRCNDEYDTEYNESIFISKRMKETRKAIFCNLEGFNTLSFAQFWVPKSQIKEDKIKNWWLDEKGLLNK